MNETGQDQESEAQTRPAWRQLIVIGAGVLVIATAAVATLALPRLADPVSVIIAGLCLLVAWAKR